jgi:CheY-like chemotaxis protein
MRSIPNLPATPSTTTAVVPVGPKRILVVDDDPAVRQVVAAVLQHTGHQVETAADGEAAWKALLTTTYDLLVTDHLMPKVSGLALVRLIRVARMALPVIMTSGSMEDALLPRDPWSRVDAFVRKPFTPSELLAVVGRFVPATGPAAASPNFSRPSDHCVFG